MFTFLTRCGNGLHPLWWRRGVGYNQGGVWRIPLVACFHGGLGSLFTFAGICIWAITNRFIKQKKKKKKKEKRFWKMKTKWDYTLVTNHNEIKRKICDKNWTKNQNVKPSIEIKLNEMALWKERKNKIKTISSKHEHG